MFNKSLLLEILAIQSFSKNDKVMQEFLYDKLALIPGVTLFNDDYGNIYGVKGEGIGPDKIYPCVVAHIDTVHSLINPDHFHVVETAGQVYGWNSNLGKMHGIGGDDKVGIYMVLQLLSEQDNIKIALFRDEEIGCIGSSNAHMPFFDDVTFVLQADRRGLGDWITNSNGADLQSDEFLTAIGPILQEFGYKEANGTSTDVGQLKKNKLPVCCANVGCGYYNAHTSGEYIELSETEICFNLFKRIFDDMAYQKWEHIYVPYVYPLKTAYAKPYQGGLGFEYDWKKRYPELAAKFDEEDKKAAELPGANTNGNVKKKTKAHGKRRRIKIPNI